MRRRTVTRNEARMARRRWSFTTAILAILAVAMLLFLGYVDKVSERKAATWAEQMYYAVIANGGDESTALADAIALYERVTMP